MGKSVIAWQAEDGEYFKTEDEMLIHESQQAVNDLRENFVQFLDQFVNWDLGYLELSTLDEIPHDQIEMVIEYLQNHLGDRVTKHPQIVV